MDQSKKIAADRWYVCVTVDVTIPVEKKWFDNKPLDDEQFRQIKGALGETVVFQQKKERHFISDENKGRIVKEIWDNALEMGMRYLSRDDFAAKYILKVFADQQGHRHK
ncbi:MAG: hypothetical protein KQI81_01080 [Deltaproteobacteria bacterium]|nr:hypothetical protein [Deltaproteobacteria bacterium]